ncbi:MAG: UTP--glucose-1-phosphate uridylyltransferase, partial [Anaerosomatales bacterium]
GEEIQLTDAIKELLQTEEVYAVVMTSTGYDTGNVQSWLEANVELALKTEEWGEGLRENLRRLIG